MVTSGERNSDADLCQPEKSGAVLGMVKMRRWLGRTVGVDFKS